jgi:phytol kinase
VDLIPPLDTALIVLPVAAITTLIAALIASWLRLRRNVRTPYTRKIFHFLVIGATMFVQLHWGVPGTMVYAAVVAIVVLLAVRRGAGHPLYEALARPSDEPHRTLFILVPLATTALGGVLANVLFPLWAHVGYMVVAWGDAVGEPVGTRWGRHRYRVPSLAGVPATRSIEGSAAVVIASALAAFIALVLTDVAAGTAAWVAVIIGAVTAAVEAISAHGLDNLTIQLAAAGLAASLL